MAAHRAPALVVHEQHAGIRPRVLGLGQQRAVAIEREPVRHERQAGARGVVHAVCCRAAEREVNDQVAPQLMNVVREMSSRRTKGKARQGERRQKRKLQVGVDNGIAIEAALRESEAKFRGAFIAAPIGMAVLFPEATVRDLLSRADFVVAGDDSRPGPRSIPAGSL